MVSGAQVSAPKPCTAKVTQNFSLKNHVVRDHSRESVNLPKTDKESGMDEYQTLRALRDAFFSVELGGGRGAFTCWTSRRLKESEKVKSQAV